MKQTIVVIIVPQFYVKAIKSHQVRPKKNQNLSANKKASKVKNS